MGSCSKNQRTPLQFTGKRLSPTWRNFKHYLDLRDHVKDYLDDGDVDQPRFGYEEEDAVKIMELLKEKVSSFSLAAELALECVLRISELTGLKGKNVDKKYGLLHMVGWAARNGIRLCWLRSPRSWIEPPDYFSAYSFLKAGNLSGRTADYPSAGEYH